MRGVDFKKRALQEGLRYGEDRMVFMRELAQNARDAGARHISIVTRYRDGVFEIVFGDDGAGMEYRHAQSYLFRLYASSKENDSSNAGRFGVGFWSILLFKPSSILIESRTAADQDWAIFLDENLDTPQRTRCTLTSSGTRITLRKTMESENEAERVMTEIEHATVRYCRYLKRNDPKATSLPIKLNGQFINEEITLGGPCWMTFNDGIVEGAVGLGTEPKIELYARGLLVWRGTLLDELKYGTKSANTISHPDGLAPVYKLNGNKLNVTLDRRAVVDDSQLDRVRRIARFRMRQLLRAYLDQVSPRPLSERIADLFIGLGEEIRLRGYIPVLIAVVFATLIVGGAAAAYRMLPGERVSPVKDEIPGGQTTVTVTVPAKTGPVPLGSLMSFSGPDVNPFSAKEEILLEYNPPTKVNFSIAVFEQLDAGRGIASSPLSIKKKATAFRCRNNCVDVKLNVAARAGLLMVPAPTGWLVEPESLLLDGQTMPLQVGENGASIIKFPKATTGVLRYRTGPATTSISKKQRNQLLALPQMMTLPKQLQTVVDKASKKKTTRQKVELIRSFVENEIQYSESFETAAAYSLFFKKGLKAGWLSFVLTFKRGDCDVKNTVAIAMLRRVGVPARLAIGVVGENGRARPGMHAWIEYFDGTWREADATGFSQEAIAKKISDPPSTGPAATMTTEPVIEPDAQTENYSINDKSTDNKLVFTIVATVSAVIATLSLFAALFLALFGHEGQNINADNDEDSKLKIAAKMMTSALSHPEAWLRSGGVSRRKLLPSLGNQKQMSLEEALDLGTKGRLWSSTVKPKLAMMASLKTQVLDASDPIFGSLIRRLPGIIDLDETASLRPVRAQRLKNELFAPGQLIVHVNKMLKKAGVSEDLVWPCLVQSDDFLSQDVDLRGLGISKSIGWPTRFIAVSINSQVLKERAELRRTNPSLAAFMLLDMLLENSNLLDNQKSTIRRLAALDAIKNRRQI